MSGRTRAVVAGLTDVGRQRKHNEDCVLVKPELGLFVVADGMGGHNAGEVASKLVATSLDNYFASTAYGDPEGPIRPEDASLTEGARRLVGAVRKSNHDVFVISNTHIQHHGMGSTVVAMHLEGDVMHIAHVGDSRCYRIRGGELEQLTRDHSLVNDALELKPDLTPAEVSRLPKNIITRALGMKDAVKVDVRSEPVLPGDVFLLCSDGLTGMVQPDQILDVIELAEEPREACELLIAEANEGGGNDNISAVVLRIEELVLGAQAEDREELPLPDEPIPLVSTVQTTAKNGDANGTAHLPDIMAEDVVVSGPLDLDLPSPWAVENVVQRCRICAFEIFAGNTFCVECGAKIEERHA